MGAASAWVRSAPRITRHLAFVIPAAAERRSPPDAAGRGAFGHIIGEPTTDHAARYYKFESISLQQTVRLSTEVARRGREPRLFARVWRPCEVVRWSETGIARRYGA